MRAAPRGYPVAALRLQQSQRRLYREGAPPCGIAGALRAEYLSRPRLAESDDAPGIVGLVKAVRARYLGYIPGIFAVVPGHVQPQHVAPAVIVKKI